jgi:hypothetical protein
MQFPLSLRERVGVREVQGVRKSLKIRKLKEDFALTLPSPCGRGKKPLLSGRTQKVTFALLRFLTFFINIVLSSFR